MKKRCLFLCFIVVVSNYVSAQINSNNWTAISNVQLLNSNAFQNKFKPSVFKAFELNEDAFKKELLNVPPENLNSNHKYFAVISVPSTKGIAEKFKVGETAVMQPGLALKHPNIKTYEGRGIEDPSSQINFSVSSQGIHAKISSVNKASVYINPVNKAEQQYIVFDNESLQSNNIFHCEVSSVEAKNIIAEELNTNRNADDHKLRTYRLAVAVNGEFSQAVLDGTEITEAERKEKVLSEIVADLVRANAIYERDFGIRLQLVENEDKIIFLDPATDPFTNSSGWNKEVQHTIDSLIGDENYDIGHLLVKVNTASDNDGNAGCIACVCKTGVKGSGYTAHTDVTGDPLIVDYWAHEMGHQFGATHTFSFQYEGTTTQVEPGSGSTIMGYAGITGINDIQPHSDDYFHAISIEQITDYIRSDSGGKCAVVSETNDHAPEANAGRDYVIPASTPFRLVGSAGDSDAADVLAYNWEQMDNFKKNISSSFPQATSTGGPVFRSRISSSSTERIFPDIQTILSGNLTNTWEALPSVGRDLHFRFTVRDNHLNGGNSNSDDVVIKIDSSSGPFRVTYPNKHEVFSTGDFKKIVWNVANTNNEAVKCEAVRIELSEDSGYTYPIILADGTANDGEEYVQVPSSLTAAARIRVSAIGNIFFDISDSNFTITSSLPARWLSFTGKQELNNTVELNWTVNNELNNKLYEVQRSTDGVHFKVIGYQNAGNKSYSFIDHNPFAGADFYRLRQIDTDETYRYSSIVTVEIAKANEPWIVYPNPVKDVATIKVYSSATHFDIMLTDVTGKIVYRNSYQDVVPEQEIEIPVNSLSKGVYLIKIISDNITKSDKLLVQ